MFVVDLGDEGRRDHRDAAELGRKPGQVERDPWIGMGAAEQHRHAIVERSRPRAGTVPSVPRSTWSETRHRFRRSTARRSACASNRSMLSASPRKSIPPPATNGVTVILKMPCSRALASRAVVMFRRLQPRDAVRQAEPPRLTNTVAKCLKILSLSRSGRIGSAKFKMTSHLKARPVWIAAASDQFLSCTQCATSIQSFETGIEFGGKGSW